MQARRPGPVALLAWCAAGGLALAALASRHPIAQNVDVADRLQRESLPAQAVEQAVIGLVVVVGLVAAAWYLVSALAVLACVAAAAVGRRWDAGEEAVRRWGAPALRRTATIGVGLVIGAGLGTGATAACDASPSLPDDLRWRPVANRIEPDPGASRAVGAERYTVRPGDSLWRIAAEALQVRGRAPTVAAVAAEWPRWYAANRDVVGADPDLIRPGQVLQVPPEGDPR
jgi:nucleoid-associated protein YgaU